LLLQLDEQNRHATFITNSVTYITMVTLVTSSTVAAVATFITIVTFITKFTKIPYGFCGTLLRSLLWLIKLPKFLMVSTVPFAAMVIVGYHGYLCPLAALVMQMRLNFFALRKFPNLFLF